MSEHEQEHNEEQDPTAEGDQSPEEFAEDLESDPAYNPEDEMLKREKGG